MNGATHFDTAAWLAYAGASVEVPQREEMEAHAGGCAACSALRRSSKELVISLADERTWNESEPAAAPAGAVFSRIRAAAIEHARNRARATEKAESLSYLSDEELVRRLHGQEHASAAMVLELGSRARGVLERDPRRALFLADLAVSLSHKLPRGPENLHAKGTAWKERGNALRFVGELNEALAAYIRSRSHFLASSVGAIDVAQTDLGRAMVLRAMGDLTAAAAIARTSAATFLEFGDARRWLHAKLLAAAITYSLGQITEARDAFLELLNAAQEQQDLESLSRLFNNLGHCYVDLGDCDAACTYLLQAIATYRELGMETEAIRTRWALAKMLLHAGRSSEADSRLAEVAEEFSSRGMLLAWALATLDRVEALLVLGRSAEVPLLLEGTLARLATSGAQRGVIMALAYLREAASAGSASTKKVTQVRAFLERLPHEENLLFLPPPE